MTTSTAQPTGPETTTTTCPVRGIYFATHFGNWYVNAPVEEVCDYIKDLAGRGINHLMLWFDLSNHPSLDAPEAQSLLQRLRRFARTASDAGMKVGLVRVANEAWRNSPPHLRANPHRGRGAIMLGDVCPSLPEARRLIEQTSIEVFGLFDHLDFLCVWPYDSGGCGCERCQPWPSEGFLVSGEILARQFRKRFPNGQVILSTWFMDSDEWKPLRAKIESGAVDWIDAIMAEEMAEWTAGNSLYDLLNGDAPRGLPVLGFPEISMEGTSPWGGCGATPRPAAIEKRWKATGSHVAGGFPYSEGMYEDVNKAIYAGFYARRDRSVDDILREYVAKEFSPDVVSEGVEMLRLMETTHPRRGLAVRDLGAAPRVWELASHIHAKLSPAVAAHWRWRIHYLRARIDALLAAQPGVITDELRAVFAELHAIYYTDETTLINWLMPPLPPQKTAHDPRNLAAGKPVSVSSTHPSLPGSERALVDDVVAAFDPDNYWSSASGDKKPTVTIDLGAAEKISEVLLQFRGGINYRFVPAWVTVEMSRDGRDFEPALRESRNVPVSGQIYKQWFYTYPVGKTALHVRVIFGPSEEPDSPDSGCVQLAEVRVYGEIK